MRVFLHAGGHLATAMPALRRHLGSPRRALFIPYALHDHDASTAQLRGKYFDSIDVDLVGLHRMRNPAAAIADAEAIVVGGGNTFRLLKAMQELKLIDPIRRAVAAGVPYFGSSAGANVAGPSIRTTNDMPIVELRNFEALHLVRFQINPHFIDSPARAVGETRAERLWQFLEENDVPIVGLRAGSWLVVEGRSIKLRGAAGAVLMMRGAKMRRLRPGADLSDLRLRRSRFDSSAG
jgi:dipeptidase E